MAHEHPNPKEDEEYNPALAMVITRVMSDINSKTIAQGATFAQQFMYQKGIKKWGNKGREAASIELDQLHRQACFTPISMATMTPEEKQKAQNALMF
jgi:hypothetical protein